MFTYKNKILLFENWVKGQISHVKDLFDAHVNFRITDEFVDVVRIIGCVNTTFKNAFSKQKREFSFSNQCNFSKMK